MKFGVQFKEYREDYLQIKQNVAAFELNIDPASLSNYERGDRDFSTGMLPVVKETFAIPDDYFLAMVLGTPLKSVRTQSQTQPAKTQEMKEQYMNSFIDRHRQLFEESPELRGFVALASNFTEKDRRNFFNAKKSLLTLFLKLSEQKKEES